MSTATEPLPPAVDSPASAPSPGSAAKACPFCGYSGNIHINPEKTTDPKFFYYAAHCQRCGAQGPLGYTREEACQCWQARLEPLDSDSSENGNPFLERPEARPSIGMGDARYWQNNQIQRAEGSSAMPG